MEPKVTNFLSVECQRCGSAPGEPCVKAPSGEEAAYVHEARITAARWSEEDRQKDKVGYVQ